MYDLLKAQTRGRSAGLDRRRVPYNMGTRRRQPERRVCGGRRRVAVAATRPAVAVTRPWRGLWDCPRSVWCHRLEVLAQLARIRQALLGRYEVRVRAGEIEVVVGVPREDMHVVMPYVLVSSRLVVLAY
jgi:hypothetical protein